MKNTLWIKFIAILLCALCLLTAAASGLCLGVLTYSGWTDDPYDDELERAIQDQMYWTVNWMVQAWANQEYGNMPERIAQLRRAERTSWGWTLNWDDVSYEIQDTDGEVLKQLDNSVQPVRELEYLFSPVEYEEYLGAGSLSKEDDPDVKWCSVADETQINAIEYSYHSKTLEDPIVVKLSMGESAVEVPMPYVLMGLIAGHNTALTLILVISLLLFAALAVFLCSCAGCKKGSTEIKAGGFNALPLDLYGGGVAALCIGLAYLAFIMFQNAIDQTSSQGITSTVLTVAVMGYCGCVLFVCFCFAFAAQVKMGHGHWFWNTVAGRCLKLAGRLLHKLFLFLPELWRFVLRIVKDVFKVAGALVTLLWSWAKTALRFLGRLLRRVGKLCERTLSLLPLTWQWIVTGGVLAVWLLLAFLSGRQSMAVLWCVAALVTVMYGSNCFGTLLDAAKRMRGGDLESKVEEKYLVGCFREFADELNGLADVAMVAAQNQLKSERMKTELITNVSHDIKTPLTSIINYVDLLGKPHTAEEDKTYVEVLSRQSQRLKKLIDDLMEMSKASTGNVQVEIARIDAVEAVTQALGEFADKLTAAGLTPVFHQSEEAIFLLADGRLLWRAMSNVLSNAVKYALPGTRLYVDVSAAEDKAIISFKNISGAQLNISAEELMERFVRGDSSRNTEGSGLGLNIAKSLMELQKGQLQLLVDGDLFKVTLVFPRAN